MVDILLEVSLLSSQLALPHVGHLQTVYRAFGYLKQVSKRKLYFDPREPMISKDRSQKFYWGYFYPSACEPIPLDIPISIGKSVFTHCFVDANHAGENTIIIPMTGILIFCNRDPIIWHSKRQYGVETSTFGSEFTAMKNSDRVQDSLRNKSSV